MKYLDKAGLSRLWANLKSKLTGKEDKSNKVTSITSSSTDIQYPSAKAVYNALQNNSDTIFDLVYPVGSYYETSDTSFDPNVTWGGTWELEVDGTVLVSKSTASGSKFNVVVGTVIGEETHKLTVNEMPSHYHALNTVINGANPGDSAPYRIQTDKYQWGGTGVYTSTDGTGGSQSHNNVQPSKVVNRWHRTA